MLGVPLSEWVLESVLRDGLNEIRVKPQILDGLFARLTQTHFNQQYGQPKIEELKTFFTTNQIRIVQALGQVPTSLPCLSIQMLQSTEDEGLQNMGNLFPEFDEDITPNTYVEDVTPLTYDTVTGRLTVDNSVDLSVVCPGWIFEDAAGNTFIIGSGNSNLSGNKYINIGKGVEPDLSGNGKITSSINFKRTDRRMIRLRETINIGCHVKDKVHLVKYLYYIVQYILKSRQEALIKRGIHLDFGVGSVFDRDETFSNENVYSRYCQVNCLTEFVWNQEEVALIDCFDPTIKTPAPNFDSKKAIPYNTSDSED